MSTCPHCSHVSVEKPKRCPVCGGYFSKITQLLGEEAAKEEQAKFSYRCRQFLTSKHKPRILQQACRNFYRRLTFKSKLALWLIFCWVFMMMVVVL